MVVRYTDGTEETFKPQRWEISANVLRLEDADGTTWIPLAVIRKVTRQ